METLQWWLDRVDGAKQMRDGWEAICPAHNDDKPSLHLNETDDSRALVHCFAGCKYSDIHAAADQRGGPRELEVPSPKVTITDRSSPIQWWETYTGIPWADWESLGVASDSKSIHFTWRSSNVVKIRHHKSKEFSWAPEGLSRPYLWPEPEETLPSEIWLTEGETDCGVLRHLGLTAFARTKGAASSAGPSLWRQMYARGVRVVYIAPAGDEAGISGAFSLAKVRSTPKF